MTPTQKLKAILSMPIGPLPSRPWTLSTLLVVLVAANTCLSYFSIPLLPTLWILLLGVLVPLLLLGATPALNSSGVKNHSAMEIISVLPSWLWWVLVGLALGLRLAFLGTLFQWPLKDEGIFGYFAINLCERWDGSLLQGLNQLPTLFTWGQSVFFKLLHPSLSSLWLYPAFWSALTLPVAWRACRQFLSRSASLLVWGAAAFGFWPLFIGRFSTQAVFMVFWEWALVWALGVFWNAPPGRRKTNLILLAVMAGGGFYTYLSWPAVMILAILALSIAPFPALKDRLLSVLAFGVMSGLVALPLALSYTGHRLDYFHHLLSVGSDHHWTDHLRLWAAYSSDLFWGCRNASFRYGPLWGGFMNPLASSFFLLGVIAWLKSNPGATFFFLVPAAAALFAPALLSNDFEDMRMVQWIPILAIGTGLGLHYFLRSIRSNRRPVVLSVISLGVLFLDTVHLFGVYPGHWEKNLTYYNEHRSPEFYKAYPWLRNEAKENGPGLVLLNFNPDPYDQTLYVATYAFNAAENPGLDPQKARWAAVLVNIHEGPYLERLFPKGRYLWLSEGLKRRDGGFLLAIIPLDPQGQQRLDSWRQADLTLKGLTRSVMERGVDPEQGPMLDLLQQVYPRFQGDSFLESRYWRITALHLLAQGDRAGAIAAEKMAIQKGMPMAHLYNEMGCLLFAEKRWSEADKAFEEAQRLTPNFTDSDGNLRDLRSITGKDRGR